MKITEPTNTEQWVRQAQAGDKDAFDALVRRYQNPAVAYAVSLLRGRYALAEDAAQEAFLMAYQDLNALREPAAFGTWLRRLIFKACDRLHRRKEFQMSASLDPALEIRATPDSDPAILHERQYRRREVRQAVADLPEADRTALTLFYLADYSVDEIAAFLEITLPATKKRLERARTRLKERMLIMAETTLREDAPSRDRRFVETSALLRRLTEMLQQDTNVVAVYRIRGLADERFADDAWNEINLHVVLTDSAMDTLATGRRDFVSRIAEPFLMVEAPQNAPELGYYLMALYDGEAGPYEVDWNWHMQSRANITAGAHVLFDRANLPRTEEPKVWGFLSEDQYPEALRQALKNRTDDEKRTDEARNHVSSFFAMTMIAGKTLAREPFATGTPFREMLSNLLGNTRRILALSEESLPENNHPAHPIAKLAELRRFVGEMETLLPMVTSQGVALSSLVLPRTREYLDKIEEALRTDGVV